MLLNKKDIFERYDLYTGLSYLLLLGPVMITLKLSIIYEVILFIFFCITIFISNKINKKYKFNLIEAGGIFYPLLSKETSKKISMSEKIYNFCFYYSLLLIYFIAALYTLLFQDFKLAIAFFCILFFDFCYIHFSAYKQNKESK